MFGEVIRVIYLTMQGKVVLIRILLMIKLKFPMFYIIMVKVKVLVTELAMALLLVLVVMVLVIPVLLSFLVLITTLLKLQRLLKKKRNLRRVERRSNLHDPVVLNDNNFVSSNPSSSERFNTFVDEKPNVNNGLYTNSKIVRSSILTRLKCKPLQYG